MRRSRRRGCSCADPETSFAFILGVTPPVSAIGASASCGRRSVRRVLQHDQRDRLRADLRRSYVIARWIASWSAARREPAPSPKPRVGGARESRQFIILVG
jgi:hypothetical protein